jgi:hypothetical protein
MLPEDIKSCTIVRLLVSVRPERKRGWYYRKAEELLIGGTLSAIVSTVEAGSLTIVTVGYH